MIRPLRTILSPSAYHGHGKRPPFFEGWYFKLVDSTEQHRYAVIPGIFLSEDVNRHHAFVQVLDGQTGQSTYHRYDAEKFWAADGAFEVYIGPNLFTADRLLLDLQTSAMTVRGELRFRDLAPWPVSLVSPGIMGWYSWVPFMECYHGVVSLDHSIEGTLAINGRGIDFSGGRGYIEKDWGKAFPEAWIWLQSNHFGEPGVSLTASVAIIPWVRRSFAGFIVGLWHAGRLYRFATYTGARLEKLNITERDVILAVGDQHERLEIRATRPAGGLLQAPTPEDMGRRIAETLDAMVEVRLYCSERGTWHQQFAGTGRHAGLEAVGDLERLRAMWRAAM